MQRFRNVLVVAQPDADPSGALREAARLATANEAHITVFDAVAPIRPGARSAAHGDGSVQSLLVSARHAELEALIARTPDADAEIVVAVGTTFLETIRRVITHGHDLVVTAPDQEQDAAGLARASTTMHLLRKCPVPVWVHRDTPQDRPDVLAAVGPFDGGEPSALDHTLVRLGASLAARRGGRFHVVHGWHLEGETLLRRGRVHLPAETVDALVDEAEAMGRDGLAKLLADGGVDRTEAGIHLVNGRPVAAISEVADAVRPGVVVMGTVARSGIAGLIMGNTAEATLGWLTAGVLAVKPDGFVSPVTATSPRRPSQPGSAAAQ